MIAAGAVAAVALAVYLGLRDGIDRAAARLTLSPLPSPDPLDRHRWTYP